MNLRQKQWGVFIKPYTTESGRALPYDGEPYRVSSCQRSSSSCTDYTKLEGGAAYMLYKSKNNDNPTSSYVIAKEIVKEVMDDLGYSKNDIIVTEITPTDYLVEIGG